jgi:hypothetical protein
MEIQLKYDGNKPSPPRRAGMLGEIVQIRINYFTEPARRGGYFYLVLCTFLYYFKVIDALGGFFEEFTECDWFYFLPKSGLTHFKFS